MYIVFDGVSVGFICDVGNTTGLNHLTYIFCFPKATLFDFNIKKAELLSLSRQIHKLLRMKEPIILTQVL
jgi:hypothetical protein